MTANPGPIGGERPDGATRGGDTSLQELSALSPDTVQRLSRAYYATYHGPQGDAPGADAPTDPVDHHEICKLT